MTSQPGEITWLRLWDTDNVIRAIKPKTPPIYFVAMEIPAVMIQWNLRIKDTLGAELLSSFQRLSFGGRSEPICNL